MRNISSHLYIFANKVELIFTVFVSFTLFQESIMYCSHVWITSTVMCLAFYITALVKAEPWSSQSSKKGSLKLLRKDIVTLLTLLPLF